ncbi:MAG TPA: DUF4388 domain-containing protein [Thermoanaerobaculia bacterium]|nr:DUF4388 domain-containing protein [Thermoanaerobaculia bacterium]
MKLEGDIGEIHLVDRLVELGREHFTGAIRFENDGIIKIIYFKGGDVLSASTNDRADSIDEILLRAGKINKDHLKQALAKRKETETLGDALLNLGFITRKELTWARRVQVIGTIRSVSAWTSGSFTIVSDYLPKREEGTLFSLQQIIIELIVTDQDRSRFERELDGGNAIFQQTADFATSFRGLGLNQDAEDIVNQVDGRKSAAEVAAASGKDAFNVYKLLYALEVLGQLAKAWKPQVIDEVSSPAWTPPPPAAPPPIPAVNSHWDAPEPQFETEDASLDWGGPPPNLGDSQPSPRDLPPWDGTGKTREVPQMPAWDAPEPPLETPRPMAAGSHDDNWGFDDAQIETAKRGSAAAAEQIAPAEPAAPPKRRFGLIVTLLVIAVLGAAGYGGFIWWLKKGEERDNVTPRAKAAGRPLRPRSRLAPGAASPATTAATSGTSPITSTGISTTAPTSTAASSPLVVTSAKGPAPTGAATPAPKPSQPNAAASPVPPAAVVIPKTAGSRLGGAPSPSATSAATATSPRGATQQPKAQPPAKPVAATTASAATTRIESRPAGATPLITNQPKGTERQPATHPPVRPASTPSSDPQRGRYDALARENAAMAGTGFTIQFEVACETSSVDRAVKEGGTSIWFVPVEYHNRACYRVFWGKYPTREEAVKAIGQIPKDLRGGTPVVMAIPK